MNIKKTLQDKEEECLHTGSKNWFLNFISLELNSVQASLFLIILQCHFNLISLELNSAGHPPFSLFL